MKITKQNTIKNQLTDHKQPTDSSPTKHQYITNNKQRQQIEHYVTNCSIGDWFVLYQMNKNMNKRFFAEFLAALSLKVNPEADDMDDPEITNDEYRQFMQYLEDNPDYELSEGTTIESLKPDTTVWSSDFTHHYGDPLLAYYWSHPAFDDYPVVGVSWESAREFARWRTKFLNDYRKEEGLLPFPSFRLPTEAEWEYAARGGRDNVKYPWGNPYTRNSRGCVLANFKPGRGNYVDDGYAYTSPVGVFFPNDFGLYDMSGNVAEWCEDAYIDSYNPVVWDLNPIYRDDSNDKKVIRGGSWKDIAFFIEVATRTFEYKDSTRAFIGFRTAMPHLGRNLESF